MYFIYILQSETSGKHYVGSTGDLEQRLRDHNRGTTRSTKNKGPWKVVYTEPATNRITAGRRERQIKSYKGGEAFKELIGRN